MPKSMQAKAPFTAFTVPVTVAVAVRDAVAVASPLLLHFRVHVKCSTVADIVNSWVPFRQRSQYKPENNFATIS